MKMTGIQQTSNINYKYWSVAELMPKKDMRELQYDRLVEQINYLWDKSTFYQEKWKKFGFDPGMMHDISDIRKIPILQKEEIRVSQAENPPFGMARIPERGPITRIALTSGTTGEPVLIPFTEDDYFGVFCEGGVRALWSAGVRKEDVVHAAYGFLPFVGLAGVYDAAEHFIGSMVVPGGAWDSMVRLRMIQKLKVTVLMGTPTYLLYLAQIARENGIDPTTFNVRLVMTTGESGKASIENTGLRLENAWGAVVHDFSGTQETNYISWTCEHGTAHLNEDLLYFEVLDPDTHEPVAPGEPGKLVVTDLVQKTHPMIRFDTGDIVEGIDTDYQCECGRTLSRLKGFRGRTGDIIKVKGVCVSVSGIENILRGIPECSDQYEYVTVLDEYRRDGIVVRLEPQKGIPTEEWDSLRRKVEDLLHQAFIIKMKVEVLPPGTLPTFDLKAKRFRDLRS